MKLLKELTLFASLSLSLCAHAYDVRTVVNENKSSLAVSGEMSQFTLDEGSISGTGVKVDFSHGFTKDIALELYLSTAIGGGSSVSASFTGLGGYALYNLLGTCCQENRTISVDGTTVVKETMAQKHLLQVGIGLDQILLNGSKGVYSTSGLGIGGNYQFNVWDFKVKISARMAQMTANKEKVQATFFGAGLVFPL